MNSKAAMSIEIPEFGWVGDKKKIEIRGERLIRDIFELAAVMETDFTAATLRILRTSIRRVIDEERGVNQRLSNLAITPSSAQASPLSQPGNFEQNVSEEQTNITRPQTTSKSGADLI